MIDRELLRQHVSSQGEIDPFEFQRTVDDRIALFGGDASFHRYLSTRGLSMQQWRNEMKVDFALAHLEAVAIERDADQTYRVLTGKPASQPRYEVSSVVVTGRWGDRVSGQPEATLDRVPSSAVLARTEPVWVSPDELTPAGLAAIEEGRPGYLTTAIPNPRGPMFFIVHQKSEERVADEAGVQVAKDLLEDLGRAKARDRLLRELRAQATIEYAEGHRPEKP